MANIESLSKQLGALLLEKKWTVTTAESCTGGGVSKAITEVAGSSAYFDCAFITYSNLAKQKLVMVNADTLSKYGAVSEQTVLEMAQGSVMNASANMGIAVSGIAGPGGGTKDKPVGTVWIAVFIQYLLDEKTVAHNFSQQFNFNGERTAVRVAAVEASLNMALKAIDEIKLKKQ